VAGAQSGEVFETFGVSFEHELPTRTWLLLSAERLASEARSSIGIFERDKARLDDKRLPSETSQELDFEECSFSASINQLVGEEWSFGASYRASRADLRIDLPEVSVSDYPPAPAHASDPARSASFRPL
jgi:hypothetical protein